MFKKRQNIAVSELQQLIKGCLSGDRSCQRRIYDIYAPKMMPLCLRYSKNQEEAEEVLQDGFLNMYNSMDQYKRKGTFEGWLRKIMINCALMRYRGKVQLHRITELTEDYDFLSTGDEFIDRLSEKELIRLIQQLPPAYRMVFNLYVFEGMKHREIALLLNITEGTSKSNLSDARTILKRSLLGNLKAAK
jgi:RNA polymerase sigma-70 factor (ECF subfamily)